MSPSAVEIVTIRVLGGFRVECGGETVPAGRWSRPGARRLLKALALADGGRMHRSRLAALLWPRADRVSAARSLRVALHAVRRALEPDLPSRAPSSYVVSGEDGSVELTRGRVRVDLVAVRDAAVGARPRELHRLVRTLLPELLPDDDHEPFVRAAREAHRELRRTLAVACAGQGPVAAPGSSWDPLDESLDDVLREVLLADPLAADVCRVLLERLIASGRHGEAVQRYHAHRGALVDSCGTEPDRPLRDLFALALSAPFPIAPSDGGLPRFVGREAELAMLTALPRRAGPPVVELTGEPGIGLSRTLSEAAARLRRSGAHVLHSGGSFTGMDSGYRAVLAPFDAFVESLHADARAAVALAHPDLAAVLPSLYGDMARADETSVTDLCAFVTALARSRPVVLLLDDLELAGPVAVEALRRLVTRCARLPVKFVVACRSPERRWPGHIGAAHRLVLGRLSEAQCARLAGGGDTGREVFALSGGNPLCAVDVVRGSAGLATGRLRREAPQVREVVALISPHASGLARAALTRKADPTARARILAGLDQALCLGWVRAVPGTDGPVYTVALRVGRAVAAAGSAWTAGARPLQGSRPG
ncbi:AAA family ATPase [Streptomyces sp. NPDC056452]|uniref:AAA family ATPase n=1 Tax=Streptomyces sp. NPDC056452 TaxID=3345821 RepID=UPI0036AD79F5